MYAALRLFRGSLVEKSRLEVGAKSAESARHQRHQRVEGQIDSFRRQVQELLASVGNSMEQMQSTAKTLAMAAEETSARAIGAASASNEASVKSTHGGQGGRRIGDFSAGGQSADWGYQTAMSRCCEAIGPAGMPEISRVLAQHGRAGVPLYPYIPRVVMWHSFQ
jgi:hypothetical protein